MIARLTGTVASVEDGRCVIDVGGVGYLVQASTRTVAALPRAPETARLLIETVVREDAILLFGFADAAERDWFRLLTTVQGVGAKVALGVLSALAPDALAASVAAGDTAALARAPGVGARLAQRLATELRDKAPAMSGAATGAGMGAVTGAAPRGGVAEDAVSALVNLGYRPAEARAAVARAAGRAPEAGLDTLVRDSLRELARPPGRTE